MPDRREKNERNVRLAAGLLVAAEKLSFEHHLQNPAQPTPESISQLDDAAFAVLHTFIPSDEAGGTTGK